MLADVLHHKTWCAAHEDEIRRFTGHLGDRLVRCQACRALAVDHSPAVPIAVATPSPGPRTRHRCRDHDNPVDPRGRGCVQCVAERQPARKARLEPDPLEW